MSGSAYLPMARAGMASARSFVRKKRTPEVGRARRADFEAILDRFDDENVFVHAGLSDIKTAFDTNPYEYLYSQLETHFESILAPGYTPSFKRTGVFHLEYSRPEYGMFPVLFKEDAEYRTADPLHSILVAGPYRFDGCEISPTFGPDGCFAQLERDNVLSLSIGTPAFRPTNIHQIECSMGVPYVRESTHEGVVYTDAVTHHEVSQTNFTNENPRLYAFNRAKMERRLKRAGVMETHSLNGLKIYAVRTGDIDAVLRPEVERDPYYLVT